MVFYGCSPQTKSRLQSRDSRAAEGKVLGKMKALLRFLLSKRTLTFKETSAPALKGTKALGPIFGMDPMYKVYCGFD